MGVEHVIERKKRVEESGGRCCKKEKESLVYKPIIINVAIRHRSLYLYGDANVTLADRHATASSMIRMEAADFMPLLVELLVGLSYPYSYSLNLNYAVSLFNGTSFR